jgi:RecA-family ATPase
MQNTLKLLEYIDPARLNYQEWVSVGMALKQDGFTASDWDNWSKRDPARYHPGECYKKWDSFQGASNPVTSGTIAQLAKEQGWSPSDDSYELGWDDVIGSHENVIIDTNWVEGQEVIAPDDPNWHPAAQLIKYLETLFEASENVGYVCDSWYDEEKKKYLPKKGDCDRTAGQLIEELNKCNDDIGAVLGDYKPEAGAWIRFNPLDGKGVKNENVTDFRYALVESDDMDIEKQNAMIRQLELPVACLVHSGGKSLHAIVRIEASSYDEYRKRVDFLYEVCKKNGLAIDSQNRNPSRLSRMPGVIRNGKKQFLVDVNIGKSSWTEWKEWIEGVNDDMPEPESLATVWDVLPPLAQPLIDGVLRQGHKMLLAGPSKAGKSFSLIELCCAIAEGKSWIGWPCAQGRVMYVNLELDRASCLHRFRDVYNALGWEPQNVGNIDIWNLRGKSVPMDKLAPKLIRRAAKKGYIAIIIDPIYKVITGDENSADQMAHFCNQFDKVCTDLGSAVIYCHHHSKGMQGQKRSMDRASGSGVFARDPDALLDLIELELDDSMVQQETSKVVLTVCEQELERLGLLGQVSPEERRTIKTMFDACKRVMTIEQWTQLLAPIDEAERAIKKRTAWRIEGTLREFPKFTPVNLWFDYPIHKLDEEGVLRDAQPDSDRPPWQKGAEKRRSKAKSNKEDSKQKLEDAIQNCKFGDPPTKKELADYLGVSTRTVTEKLREHGGYIVDKNNGYTIVRVENNSDE